MTESAAAIDVFISHASADDSIVTRITRYQRFWDHRLGRSRTWDPTRHELVMGD